MIVARGDTLLPLRKYGMTTDFGTVALLIGLIGGLALFLFGMEIMTRALEQVTGASMKGSLRG